MSRNERMLAEALLRKCGSDGGHEFSIVIDDPDKGIWDVSRRYYVDADRAGFCGYMKDTVASNLSQLEASWMVDLLNGLLEERREARRLRYA